MAAQNTTNVPTTAQQGFTTMDQNQGDTPQQQQQPSSDIPAPSSSNPAATYTHDSIAARMMFEEAAIEHTETYYKSRATKAIKKVDKALEKKDG